jgi:hypothetical protein
MTSRLHAISRRRRAGAETALVAAMAWITTISVARGMGSMPGTLLVIWVPGLAPALKPAPLMPVT